MNDFYESDDECQNVTNQSNQVHRNTFVNEFLPLNEQIEELVKCEYNDDLARSFPEFVEKSFELHTAAKILLETLLIDNGPFSKVTKHQKSDLVMITLNDTKKIQEAAISMKSSLYASDCKKQTCFHELKSRMISLAKTLKLVLDMWNESQLSLIFETLDKFSVAVQELVDAKVGWDLSGPYRSAATELVKLDKAIQKLSSNITKKVIIASVDILKRQLRLLLGILSKVCLSCLLFAQEKSLKDFRSICVSRIIEVVACIVDELSDHTQMSEVPQADIFTLAGKSVYKLAKTCPYRSENEYIDFLEDVKPHLELAIKHSNAVSTYTSTDSPEEKTLEATNNMMKNLTSFSDLCCGRKKLTFGVVKKKMEQFSKSYRQFETATNCVLVDATESVLRSPFRAILDLFSDFETFNKFDKAEQRMAQHKRDADSLFIFSGLVKSIVSTEGAHAIEACLVLLDWVDPFLVSAMENAAQEQHLTNRLKMIATVWVELVVDLRSAILEAIPRKFFLAQYEAAIKELQRLRMPDRNEPDFDYMLVRSTRLTNRIISFYNSHWLRQQTEHGPERGALKVCARKIEKLRNSKDPMDPNKPEDSSCLTEILGDLLCVLYCMRVLAEKDVPETDPPYMVPSYHLTSNGEISRLTGEALNLSRSDFSLDITQYLAHDLTPSLTNVSNTERNLSCMMAKFVPTFDPRISFGRQDASSIKAEDVEDNFVHLEISDCSENQNLSDCLKGLAEVCEVMNDPVIPEAEVAPQTLDIKAMSNELNVWPKNCFENEFKADLSLEK